MSKLIRNIYIKSRYDIGFGESAVISADGDFITTDESDLTLIRAKLKETFAYIWGDPDVLVMFDFEVEDDKDEETK